MATSLRNYTFKTSSIVLFILISIWAIIFYTYIVDEVYDTVDDGLHSQKIEVIRVAYDDEQILSKSEFDVNLYRITPIEDSYYSKDDSYSTEYMQMPYDEEEEPYRILKTHFRDSKGRGYLLEIASSSLEQDELFYDLSTALIVLYMTLIVSLFIINNIVLANAFRPFKRILKVLSNYRFGREEVVNLPRGKVKEFNELATDVEHMIERNQAIFIQQKEFIENASHELQTPLAIVQNKLDWMIEQEELPEELLLQVVEIKQTVMRMTHLNRSLLMLSKIENHQYQSEDKMVLNGVVEQLCTEYVDLFEFKGIELKLINREPLELFVNEQLITILLSNLLRNAIRYTPKEGRIEVSIVKDRVVIKNQAQDGALDCDQIFKRFFKKSDEKQSTGLGLSIVKSIVDQYPNLTLIYNYEEGFHAFSLLKL